MKKVGVFGCTGYAASELIKHLLNHPKIHIVFIASDSNSGKKYETMYPQFTYRQSLPMMITYTEADQMIPSCDLVFTALPSGLSYDIARRCRQFNTRLIDLSSDFRHKDGHDISGKVVYGLSEIFREDIKTADIIANPGCYATSILLPALPLIRNELVKPTFIADSKSGTSGAGRGLRQDTLYCEVNENFKAYSPFTHKHVPEMEEILEGKATITFVPHLLPINRGILSTLYFTLNPHITEVELTKTFDQYYGHEKYVHISNHLPDIKQVTYTNHCIFGFQIHGNTLLVVSVIDNLIKGASGQAIQNMNIMFGFEEDYYG